MANRTAPMNSPLAPNSWIGIIGGGQLGRMLAMSAAQLGFKVCIYSPEVKCPASEVASKTITGSYTDEAALKEFASIVDVVTYEFENVPTETVQWLSAAGLNVRPNRRALETAQDRLVEKQFLNSLGANTAAFHPVDDLKSLEEGLAIVGHRAILKTRRLGYDGKGQTRITQDSVDLAGDFEKAIDFAWREVGAAPSILEGFVDFEREISVIGARSASGDVALYDPAENVHEDGILNSSSIPTSAPTALIDRAKDITQKVLVSLDYVGVMGVEFFQTKDDVIVNEFAPRVHNSGHWTMDACAISQFEQHIRAVAGWPLGDPTRHSDAHMENLIGVGADQWRDLNRQDQTAIHLYGKSEMREGRKMGHFTHITPRCDRR